MRRVIQRQLNVCFWPTPAARSVINSVAGTNPTRTVGSGDRKIISPILGRC